MRKQIKRFAFMEILHDHGINKKYYKDFSPCIVDTMGIKGMENTFLIETDILEALIRKYRKERDIQSEEEKPLFF